jgi:hypothetical protein
MPKEIENYIEENLCADDREVALKLVAFLRVNNFSFHKDNGYWIDKIYYIVKYNNNCICFIAIKDPDEQDNRWTVWSDDIDSTLLDAFSVDDELKEIAWNHVDHCGNCGSCGGGRQKSIFGKKFNDVCGCTFRFDNPNADDLRFLYKMAEIQKNGMMI